MPAVSFVLEGSLKSSLVTSPYRRLLLFCTRHPAGPNPTAVTERHARSTTTTSKGRESMDMDVHSSLFEKLWSNWMLINITGLGKYDANPYRSNPFAYGDNNNLVIAASAVTSSVLEHHRSQPDVSHFCHRTVLSFGVVPTTALRLHIHSSPCTSSLLQATGTAFGVGRLRGPGIAVRTSRVRTCCNSFFFNEVYQ